MRCSQCGAAAERCSHCAGALCERRLCAELHDASCAALSVLPAQSIAIPASITFKPKPRRERNPEAERALAEQLVLLIVKHRQAGRSALLVGDLDAAFDELLSARQLEPNLDRLGAAARQCVPSDWELETDLTPLARALSSRLHPRAAEAWRRLLDDRPARSIQAEAADWLARDAVGSGDRRGALRIRHAASLLGQGSDPGAWHTAYRRAGLDPIAAFGLYLGASRLDPHTIRAMHLRDPLTDTLWSDQDARWWVRKPLERHSSIEQTDHQTEAVHRARDLASSKRDQGWLWLAEGDHAAGPLGVRALGRNVRAGSSDAADEDTFVRIRVAYEGAAERLPDVAWPWYRLAELLAWAGFAQGAQEHLAQAERRSLGDRETERSGRPLLRAFVHAGLGTGPDGLPTAARPFPTEPFGPNLAWRLRLR
jgi:hypothetical protein